MQIKAAPLLIWIRRAALASVSFLFLTVVTLWITAYSDEKRWFAHPSEQLAAVLTLSHLILANWWFHWIGGGVIGFAIGTWLDALLRRKTATLKPLAAAKPPKTLEERAEENRAYLRRPITAPIPTMQDKLGSWSITDKFNISEAACLWAGFLPTANRYRLDAVSQSKITAANRLIISELKADFDNSENALSVIGDYDKSIVTRASLMKLAERIGLW